MSDLGENDGGETVFAKALPHGKESVPLKKALADLRTSGSATMLATGSWEEEMSAQCRTKLAVRPKLARAVLFYSQHPNGKEDLASLHGGCPVLRGTKWAANLWTWSAPRPEFQGAPVKEGFEPGERIESYEPRKVSAVFRNSGKYREFDNAELYFDEDGFFGKLGPAAEIPVNTYETHRFNIKVNGEILKTFHITAEPSQLFVL
jgi:hypothetical protein